ncbi:MAG: hypothetical protein H8E14_15570, partial [Candidatus Marinimicrobia bacterium]|nr:hypothetical protein [Candidatus Neomarinimicrobiota bacterium]
MPTNYITIYSIRSLTSCIVGLSLVKCCSLLLLCIALTGCSKKSTGPEPVPTMSILPAESEIAPDQVAQLQIVLSDMDVPIFAITFRIQSDSTILTAVAENGFLPGDYFTENSISFFRQEGSIFYFSLSKTSGPEETSSTGSIGILSVSS